MTEPRWIDFTGKVALVTGAASGHGTRHGAGLRHGGRERRAGGCQSKPR